MDDSLTILAGNHSASTTLNTYPQGNSSNVTAVIRASAAGYQSRSRTITIRPTPSLTLTAADSSVSEPDGTTTLTVSVPSGDEPSSNLSVSLTHSGSATHTDDYTVGTLTIAAGQSSETATLTVTDDSTYEGNQTIRLRASATGYTTSAILSITLADDDPEPEPDPATLTLTAAPSTVSEPFGSTTLTVSVPSGDEPSSNLTVSLTHSGSAAHPDDYTVGTLTIAAGQRTGTATLTAADDSTYEGNETIRLRASATGYTNSTFVSITLSDDDTATLSLAAADTRVSEPSGATTLTVSIPTGQEPGSDLTVTLTHFGSAANSDDYTVATLTILASQGSGTATLSVVDDSAVEGDETITLVASATGYTDSASLSLTLTDNDGTPLTLTAADTSVAEPDGTTTLTVSVPTGAEPSSDLSVTLTHTGSAVQSTDYTVGTLTIAAGQSSGTATLSVADDSAFEGDETITLVASATGYTSSTALSITLSDDDAPSLSLAAADTSVSEPSGATTLTVSVPAGAEPSSDLAVTLTHSGSATHPDDYTVAALTILAGQSSRTATLTVVDDSTYEGDETIQLTASATGYTDSASLSLTLTDDDGAALTLISNATTFERGENATITIRVPAGAELTTDLTVTFAFGGTATRGGSGRGDYQVNGLLTIPAGLASASTTLLTWQRGGWDDEDTIVIIASATGYTTSSPLTLTLLGDAEPPLYVIPEATTLIAGNSTAITVWIDTAAPAPESDVTVTLSFGGTANRGCSQGAVAPFDYCAPGLLTIAAAAIDRLVYHSVILELNLSSYRMEAAKKSKGRKK